MVLVLIGEGVDANGVDDLGEVVVEEVDANDDEVDEGALKAFIGWPKGMETDAFLVLVLSKAPNFGSE